MSTANVAARAVTPVRRLLGMRDLSAAACQDMQAVQRLVADLIRRFGYSQVEVPVLESTELFLRKSGGSLASQMYSFTDPGSNAASLRPEFTSAIMRRYLEMNTGVAPAPVARWQYAGPVFRYDAHDAEGSGQFTQVGAELVGSDSLLADAELLALAAGVPAALGVDGYLLRLADLDVLDSVLDTVGLSERARSFIVANMNRIGSDGANVATTLNRAAELHIVAGRDLLDEQNDLAGAVAGLPDAEAREVLAGFMRWNGNTETLVGQRTSEEIVDRLLRKLRGGDDTGAVEHGLALAAKLASVNGDPTDAVAAAQEIVAGAGADPAAVNRLAELVDLIVEDKALAGHVSVDFGLARGIAYYNGIIFDIISKDDQQNLGGGGRYDALARALGSPHSVPALGFAYTLEKLMAVIPGGEGSTRGSEAVLVAPEGPAAYRAALRAAAEVRRDGGVAVLDVGGQPASDGEYLRTVSVGADGVVG